MFCDRYSVQVSESAAYSSTARSPNRRASLIPRGATATTRASRRAIRGGRSILRDGQTRHGHHEHEKEEGPSSQGQVSIKGLGDIFAHMLIRTQQDRMQQLQEPASQMRRDETAI